VKSDEGAGQLGRLLLSVAGGRGAANPEDDIVEVRRIRMIKGDKTIRSLEQSIEQLQETGLYQPESTIDFAAVSDEVFAETWDNDEDAVYDRWRASYGVSEK
jgi:hypothetical protein